MENNTRKRQKIIVLTFNKALIIMATAIIASAGSAVWGTLAVANTIPFRVSAMETKIKDIQQMLVDEKNVYMSLDLAMEKWEKNDETLIRIEKKLDYISERLDEHVVLK